MINLYECCHKTIEKQYHILLKREESIFEDTDIEDNHQMRVAVRRMRAAMRSFDPLIDDELKLRLKKGLKKLGRTLGAVRDLDVALVYFSEYERNFPDNQGVKFLISHYKQQREENLAALFKFLRTSKYEKAKENVLELIYDLCQKAQGIPDEIIYSAYMQAFEQVINNVYAYEQYEDLRKDEPKLHDLRIDIKYLRYNLEFLDLGTPEAKKIIKTMKKYQDSLGIINDCDVMEGRVRSILGENSLKEEEKVGVMAYLSYNEYLKRSEIENIDFPWTVLPAEEIKNVYLDKIKVSL